MCNIDGGYKGREEVLCAELPTVTGRRRSSLRRVTHCYTPRRYPCYTHCYTPESTHAIHQVGYSRVDTSVHQVGIPGWIPPYTPPQAIHHGIPPSSLHHPGYTSLLPPRLVTSPADMLCRCTATRLWARREEAAWMRDLYHRVNVRTVDKERDLCAE